MTRKFVVWALAVISFISASICVIFILNATASKSESCVLATSPISSVIDNDADFSMRQGASVRTVKGESGIRFMTFISSSFYDKMVAKGATWHTLIAPDVSVKDLNADNTNAVTFGVKEVIKPSKIVDGEKVYYNYTTCIIYENDKLTEAQLQRAYAMPLTARSFVKYTDNGVDNYIYTSEDSDTIRSISQVANKLLLNDALGNGIYQQAENADKLEVFTKYLLNENKIIKQSGVAYLTGNGALISFLSAPDGNYLATVGGVSKEISLLDGKASCDFSGLELGRKYSFSLTADSGVTYIGSVINTEKTISTETEFWNMVESYVDSSTDEQVYYTLTCDLTLTERDWYGAEYVFLDIFDGNGHTITVDKTPKYGLFGKTVGANAVIKNLKVVVHGLPNLENEKTTLTNCVFASVSKTGSRLENLFVEVKPKTLGEDMELINFGGLIGTPSDKGLITNVIVILSDEVNCALKAEKYATCGIIAGNLGGEYSKRIDAFSNVYAVSKNLRRIASFNVSSSDGFVTNSHLASNISAVGDEIEHPDKSIYQYESVDGTGGLRENFECNSISWTVDGEYICDDYKVEISLTKESLAVGESAEVKVVFGEFTLNAVIAIKSLDGDVLTVDNGRVVAIRSGVSALKIATIVDGKVITLTKEITVS